MTPFYSTTSSIPPDHCRIDFHATLTLTNGSPIPEGPPDHAAYQTIVETESPITGILGSTSVAVYVNNIVEGAGWQPEQTVEAQGFIVVNEGGLMTLCIDAGCCVLRPPAQKVDSGGSPAPVALWCSFTAMVKRELTRDHQTGRLCRWDIELLQPEGVPTVIGRCVQPERSNSTSGLD